MSGEQELAGLRVVVTREVRESEAFADRLRALGAEPVVCPALEIRFRNPPGFHDALLALERFDWVVFTSANAVRAVAERCAALGIDPARGLARPKVAAVGEPTANTLRALGVQVDLVPDLATGRALAEAMIAERVAGDLVFFPASRIASPDLPRALREAGAGVVLFAVYETLRPEELPEACRAALERGEVDVLTFFSPSAVRNFLRLAGKDVARAYPNVCIGATTASEARALGLREPLLAHGASEDGVIAALLEFNRQAAASDDLREVES